VRSPRLLGLLAGGVAAATPAAVHAAEESGGIAALGFNVPGLIAQLVNFLILLILLRLFLYRPFMRILDERKQRIAEGLEKAEEAASAASASESESARLVEEARGEGRELVARAQESAQELRTELEARARQDADQIVTRAREAIEFERDQAIQQLRGEFADLTIRAAERVVGQSLDREAHQRLIDETLVDSSFSRDGNN
jgi:F-type H+-transporting ATPase subunit b